MKINLMTDYAVRVICSVYENDRGMMTSNQISQKEEIPHGVLMKVLRVLRENGLVMSHQGRGEISGGYTLAKSLKEVTFLDIVEIMEGDIVLENIRNKKIVKSNVDDLMLSEYRKYSQAICNEMKKNTLYEILNGNTEK
jgi:Predicted transcriptional regulator